MTDLNISRYSKGKAATTNDSETDRLQLGRAIEKGRICAGELKTFLASRNTVWLWTGECATRQMRQTQPQGRGTDCGEQGLIDHRSPPRPTTTPSARTSPFTVHIGCFKRPEYDKADRDKFLSNCTNKGSATAFAGRPGLTPEYVTRRYIKCALVPSSTCLLLLIRLNPPSSMADRRDGLARWTRATFGRNLPFDVSLALYSDWPPPRGHIPDRHRLRSRCPRGRRVAIATF